MDTLTRNELFMQYEPMVKWAIRKNWPLIQALRVEREDVYQDLSIAAINAIDGFDSNKSTSLKTHVASRLQYEVLNLKRRYKACGLTGAIDDNISIRSLDYVDDDGFRLEVPYEAPYWAVEVKQIFAMLSPCELKSIGEAAKDNSSDMIIHQELLDAARSKLAGYLDLSGVA